MRYFRTCWILNISFLCSNSGQTVTCTPCSQGSSSFLKDGPWLQSLPSAQQGHFHSPCSSWCGTWGSKPPWPVAVSAVGMLHLHVCVRRALLTLSLGTAALPHLMNPQDVMPRSWVDLGGAESSSWLLQSLPGFQCVSEQPLGSPLKPSDRFFHLHHPVANQTFPISVDLHPCHIRFLQSGTIFSLMPSGKFINMNS